MKLWSGYYELSEPEKSLRFLNSVDILTYTLNFETAVRVWVFLLCLLFICLI